MSSMAPRVGDESGGIVAQDRSCISRPNLASELQA